MVHAAKKQTYWKTPISRGLGVFNDLKIFYEALELGQKTKFFSIEQLKEELSMRVKGLIFIQTITNTAANNLIRELKAFQWIKPINNESTIFTLTKEGYKAIEIKKKSDRVFLHYLITKMQEIYSIPGWFVQRLWDLNPNGQGQIVIPTPMKDWHPKKKGKKSAGWNNNLNQQIINVHKNIHHIDKNIFPIEVDTWCSRVREKWEKLNKVRSAETYFLKERLSLAMQETTVEYFFGNSLPNTTKRDFNHKYPPLPLRNYHAWCPRLLELELIFYTDFQSKIAGRLLFPVSIFRSLNQSNDDFEVLTIVKNPLGKYLSIHRPNWFCDDNSKWYICEKNFLNSLRDEYYKIYRKSGNHYVSLQDVRDRVCRLQRISATYFDELLNYVFQATLRNDAQYNISLETDIREDQKAGYQRNRRTILIDNVPCSLIAITPNE